MLADYLKRFWKSKERFEYSIAKNALIINGDTTIGTVSDIDNDKIKYYIENLKSDLSICQRIEHLIESYKKIISETELLTKDIGKNVVINIEKGLYDSHCTICKAPQNIRTRFVKLINVKSCNPTETSRFRGVKHDDLVNSLRYWFEQTRLFFGEPLVVQGNQSRNDAGVDLLLLFVNSKKKIGIQIKSHYDISESSFQKNVKAQMVDSQRHGLDFYLIGFAGDMTSNSQKEKVGRMISEISQTNDKKVLVLQPEQVYPIFQAYKNNLHPLRYVNLDYSDSIILADGMRESLLTGDNDVEVNIQITNKNIPDNSNAENKITLEMEPDRKNLKMVDEINNLAISEGVTTIYPHDLKHKLKVPETSTDLMKGEELSLTIISGKSNRITLFLTSILYDGESVTQMSTYDYFVEENVTRWIDVSDRTVRINFFYYPKDKNVSIQPHIDFSKISTKSMKTLLEDIRFWYTLCLCKYTTFSHGNSKIFSLKPLIFDFPEYFTEMIFLLIKLESLTNTSFSLCEEDLSTHNYSLIRFLTDSIERKEIALEHYRKKPLEMSMSKKDISILLDDIRNSRIIGDAYFRIVLKFDLMRQVITINLPINVAKLELNENIESISEKVDITESEVMRIAFKIKELV